LEDHFGVDFNAQSTGKEDEGDIATIDLGGRSGSRRVGLLAYGRVSGRLGAGWRIKHVTYEQVDEPRDEPWMEMEGEDGGLRRCRCG
jgi:hypothetical protein